MRLAFLAAAKAAKGALRAAFEESTDVKKGTYGGEANVDGFTEPVNENRQGDGWADIEVEHAKDGEDHSADEDHSDEKDHGDDAGDEHSGDDE